MFSKFFLKGNIGKIALVSFFSALYFYLPVMTIYYQSRGLDYIQINSLWGIITFTIFLFEVPTGVIADKIGRKYSIVAGLALQLLGEILFLFSRNYVSFLFVNVIAGIGFAFQSGCLQALVYDSLKQEGKESLMKKVMGSINAYFQSGLLLGALASSFIVSQLNPQNITTAIIFTILSVAVALIISLFLKEPKSAYVHSEQNPLQIVSQSLTTIKNNKSLRRIILLGIFATPFIGYLRNLHPPYFQLAHVPIVFLGLSLTAGGLLAILASKYAYYFEKKLGVTKAMFIATITPAIFYFLMAIIFNPIFAVLLFTINFGSMSLQEPLFSDYYNIHIPSSIRATSLSTINMFSSVYIALMGLLIGAIANVSISYAFMFMGIVILLGSVLFRINEKHVHSLNTKIES